MDARRFDALIKRLAVTPLTRATALRGVIASAAALVGMTLVVEPKTAEGKKLGKVPRKRICDCANERAESCNQRKVIKKKAKKILKRNPCAYAGGCTGESGCAVSVPPPPPPPPPSPPPPGPTCTDGIKNGSESDVDCGGSCPRCVNGKTCTTRNDCAGAYCATNGSTNVCQACPGPIGAPCGGPDRNCTCVPASSGIVCGEVSTSGVLLCQGCPPGTVYCRDTPSGGFCYKLCGAP